jgi:uncharacterized protein (DUF924 family)
MNAEQVLDFWFGSIQPSPAYLAESGKLWFGASAATDRKIAQWFSTAVNEAANGKYNSWRNHPRGSLALVILLDQFPLNIFRGQAKSYQICDLAIPVVKEGLERGFDKTYEHVEKAFYYLPLEHAEDLGLQAESVRRFTALAQACAGTPWRNWALSTLDYAQKHASVVQKFGRFPHRNEALLRASTNVEVEFLKSGPGY